MRERNVFTLLNLERFGQNEWSHVTKLLRSWDLFAEAYAAFTDCFLLEVTGVRERSTFTLLHLTELFKRGSGTELDARLWF